jgi:DNA-binding MarR family transcriptional regulator
MLSMEIIIVSMETILPDTASARAGNSALEVYLGYWLRRVSNRVSGAFARAFQERQVSVAEWVVLSEIDEHPEIRPAELADTTGLTRGAISKVLDKVEEKEWITRKTLETDNRGQLLFLTRQGRRVLPELREIADRNDQRLFDCLDVTEKATLRQLLRKLTDWHEIRDVPVE